MPDYLSTDPNAGLSRRRYLSTDPNAGAEAAAQAPTTAEAPDERNGFLGEFWRGVNPMNMLRAVDQTMRHPIDTARGVLTAQDQVRVEAMQAFESGDYVTGTRKLLNYLVPLLGPELDRAGDLLVEGRTGEGLGATAALGTQIAVPAAMQRLPRATARVLPRNRNAAAREAVEFGQREGIPVDAATATGNRFVAGTQKLADESLGGSMVADRARQGQEAALAATGERLAGRVAPRPYTAEQAGEAVRGGVASRAQRMADQATDAYSQLRQMESRAGQRGLVAAPTSPTRTTQAAFTDVPLAVDVAATKAALRPLYDTLKRESELVPLMGDKARALTALDRLMQSPDVAPLSIADAALSELKTLARVDQAFKRTAGQGAAAQAVRELDEAVVAAARRGGDDVFQALMDGRAATVNKYKAVDTFDALRAEPVQVFNQLTARQDTAVDLLRRVKRESPDQLPKLGRAYLDGLLEKATAEGGFSRAQGLWADWQKLGPGTKAMLFGDRAHIRDLDRFFLLAKRMADNPNPSGTALTLMKGGEIGLIVTNPATGAVVSLGAPALSALLHSPRAVRVLVNGLTVPLGNPAAASAAATEALSLARSVGGAPMVPVAASADPSTGRAGGSR